MRLNQMSGSEVCHPAQQVERTVPHRHQRVLAEQDRLGAMGRFGELGEDNACHASVDENPNNALDAHHHDGNGTLRGGLPAAIPEKRKMLNILYWEDNRLTYPIVCCVSRLKRKEVVKSSTFSTHTTWSSERWSAGTKSP